MGIISPWYNGKSNVRGQHFPFAQLFVNRGITSPFRSHRSLIKPADITGTNVGMSVRLEITEGRSGLKIASRRSGREDQRKKEEWFRNSSVIGLRKWEIVKRRYAGSCEEDNYFMLLSSFNHVYVYVTLVIKWRFCRFYPMKLLFISLLIPLRITFAFNVFSGRTFSVFIK